MLESFVSLCFLSRITIWIWGCFADSVISCGDIFCWLLNFFIDIFRTRCIPGLSHWLTVRSRTRFLENKMLNGVSLFISFNRKTFYPWSEITRITSKTSNSGKIVSKYWHPKFCIALFRNACFTCTNLCMHFLF